MKLQPSKQRLQLQWNKIRHFLTAGNTELPLGNTSFVAFLCRRDARFVPGTDLLSPGSSYHTMLPAWQPAVPRGRGPGGTRRIPEVAAGKGEKSRGREEEVYAQAPALPLPGNRCFPLGRCAIQAGKACPAEVTSTPATRPLNVSSAPGAVTPQSVPALSCPSSPARDPQRPT